MFWQRLVIRFVEKASGIRQCRVNCGYLYKNVLVSVFPSICRIFRIPHSYECVKQLFIESGCARESGYLENIPDAQNVSMFKLNAL